MEIVVLDTAQMGTVLKRYVDILTRKEAHILDEEGFYNREEHFENFLRDVRTEFDSHPKIRACFAHKAGVLSCINFLMGQDEYAREASTETRRYEFSFMSTVLLRTASVSEVLIGDAELLDRLLGFPNQAAPLDEAIVHYWCKVFRHLISLQTCNQRLLAALPSLVAHVHDDSVRALLSDSLGSLAGEVSLLPALKQGPDLLGRLLDKLHGSAEGSRNACDVLTAVCVTVANAQCQVAHRAVWASLAPMLPSLVHAVFDVPKGGPGGKIFYEARVEHCLTFLVELLMLHTRVSCSSDVPEGGAPMLLVKHMGSLHAMMMSQQTFVQLKAAELLTVSLVLVEEVETDPLAVAIVKAGVLRLSVQLFFQRDVNGGGRQDFLRHVLLRVFCEALACDNKPVHKDLLLPKHGGLARTIVRSTRAPLMCGSVTHTQMAMRLVEEAADRLPLVRRVVTRTRCWRSIWQELNGAAEVGDGDGSSGTEDQSSVGPPSDTENEPPERDAGALEVDSLREAKSTSAAVASGVLAEIAVPELELAAGLRAQHLHDSSAGTKADVGTAGAHGKRMDEQQSAQDSKHIALSTSFEDAPIQCLRVEGKGVQEGQDEALTRGAGGGASSFTAHAPIEISPSSPLLSQNSARSPLAEPNSDPNVLVVDDNTFKSSTVPYFDTPKPKLVKRMFYQRSAKAASPFFKSPGADIPAEWMGNEEAAGEASSRGNSTKAKVSPASSAADDATKTLTF